VPPDRVNDVAGRDGCRAPLPWTPEPPHGWTGEEPWLPFPPHAQTCNPVTEGGDLASTLHLYQRLLELRRASAALRRGTLTRLDVPRRLLAYRREHEGDVRTVVVNFGSDPADFGAEGATVDLSSADGSGQTPYDGTVPPDTALVLRGGTVTAGA
jgi:alpha-glucosidase